MAVLFSVISAVISFHSSVEVVFGISVLYSLRSKPPDNLGRIVSRDRVSVSSNSFADEEPFEFSAFASGRSALLTCGLSSSDMIGEFLFVDVIFFSVERNGLIEIASFANVGTSAHDGGEHSFVWDIRIFAHGLHLPPSASVIAAGRAAQAPFNVPERMLFATRANVACVIVFACIVVAVVIARLKEFDFPFSVSDSVDDSAFSHEETFFQW